MNPTDEEIVQIYRDTVHRIFRFVSARVGGHSHVIEDIVQETYLRAIGAWTVSTLPDNPLAWLYTVAGNLIRNYFRGKKPSSVSSKDLDSWFSHPDSKNVCVVSELIVWGLAQIKPDRAALLQEFYFDRHSMSEIGRRKGISPKAVERRLARARKDLRSKLDTYEID